MARSYNPIGFTPLPVTILTSAVYIALFAVLLVIHHVVPSAPNTATPRQWQGVNITEAWRDLQILSGRYHPYNSKASLALRKNLLDRIAEILDKNGANWTLDHNTAVLEHSQELAKVASKAITVFDDNRSNITKSGFALGGGVGSGIEYFEGTNIMVYIRGSEDDQGDWWRSESEYEGSGGVLVNAHYDSVSTGFGATDDGVGVVSVLQLIAHFSTEGNQPKKGIVALLNNGEEDGLYGAYAFTKHPLSRFPHTFLNLEGAGAGGRATLFRSTDTEVTNFYASSKYPFGTVVSADGFKRGLVRSGTDYSVFTENLGMRGLDVAFMEPRARYHTNQDDARDTSIDSLWHMLSASLQTVKGLSGYTGSAFDSSDDDKDANKGKVGAGNGSTGVYFDLLGQVFAVLELHTLFALSVALLVAGPIVLIVLEIFIQRSDKWYPFSMKKYLHSSDDDEPVQLGGFKGFFRFPIAFVVATAGVIALAYLLTKVNPLILYGSEYAVWAMMLCAWLSVAWFVLRLFDSVRPTALSRMFTLLWLYVLSWIALVLVTIGENQMKIGSGYFVVIYNAAIFVALLISYLELFALPKRSVFVEHSVYGPGTDEPEPDQGSIRSARPEDAEHDDANERTSLLNNRRPFSRYGAQNRRPSDPDHPLTEDPLLSRAYEGEQAWSSSLPSWTWSLQFIILGPINIILVGQLALFITSALHQTPADGNSVLTIYMLMAAISVGLMLPLSPFLHRLTYQIPTFLFLVFIGTLIYNIVAFPFSRDARLKVYFVQHVDLDAGSNSVAIVGVDGYVSDIVHALPSTAGKHVECDSEVGWATRRGLSACVWNGLEPNVVPLYYEGLPAQDRTPHSNVSVTAMSADVNRLRHGKVKMADWIQFNTTRLSIPGSNTTTNTAAAKEESNDILFEIQGLNTRACRLYIDNIGIRNISIATSSADSPANLSYWQSYTPEKIETNGTVIKLWTREWDGKWSVRVSTTNSTEQPDHGNDGRRGRGHLAAAANTNRASGNSTKGGEEERTKVEGRVLCIWSDANQVGVIPALDEVKRYAPVWSAVSKHSDGLVEGVKHFAI